MELLNKYIMAIQKINEGITGEQAANIIYDNDLQAVLKDDIGYTEVPAGFEWAEELKNSSMTDTSIWHQDRTYIPTTGQLSSPTAPQVGYIASVKKYEIPVGEYSFTVILQLISGTAGLCLYDEDGAFIKTVVSHQTPVEFNTQNAKYFTVTHRVTLPVSGISVKNNTIVFDDNNLIFALKSEAATKEEVQQLADETEADISNIQNSMVTKSDLGYSVISAGFEWAEELKNSDPNDSTIWYKDRGYIPATGQLSAVGSPTYEGYNASVKKYEIPVGEYSFNAIMQVVSGTTGLCLYDEDGAFIKTVVSLMVPVQFNTQNAKYFSVTYRASRPVSGISVKNNEPISLLTDPLFIPSSREDEFLKKTDVPSGVVFNRFFEVESGENFPTACEVGNFDLVRNTSVKTGNTLKDYNVKGQNFPPVSKARILSRVQISRPVCDVLPNGDLLSIQGKNIYVSTDLGANWSILVTIPEANGLYWVFALGNGELMAFDATIKGETPAGDVIGGAYVSTANKTVFTKTITHSNRYQYFVASWGVEQVGAEIYISEYGNSYPEDTVNDPSWNKGTKADAVRVWKSSNYGQTFTQYVNLNDLTALYPANGNLHIHGIHYDRYWNRLWLTSGDGSGAVKSNKKLAWTDDGVNWSGIDLSKYFSGGGAGGTPYENLQGLSMYSTPDVLLIGSDCWNNATFRVNKRERNNVTLEAAFNPSPEITDDITYFTSRFTQYADSPIFIPYGRGDSQTTAGKAARQPRIMATWNGLRFYELWLEPETPQGCLQEYFRVWKIRGEYYIHLRYPTILTQYLIKFEI